MQAVCAVLFYKGRMARLLCAHFANDAQPTRIRRRLQTNRSSHGSMLHCRQGHSTKPKSCVAIGKIQMESFDGAMCGGVHFMFRLLARPGSAQEEVQVLV
jgi:hypothetical protein